jgi:hypothetical protein
MMKTISIHEKYYSTVGNEEIGEATSKKTNRI